LQRSIQGSMVHAIDDARIAEMGRTIAYTSLTRVRDTLRTSNVLDESMRRVLPGLSRNLADLSYYALTQSDVLKQARTLAYLGLSSSIAQAFEVHGLNSASIAAWSLRSVQPIRTSALWSTLKAATTFGPIVVSPDYEDDAPFDYHPNLEWLLPETATVSGDTLDVEELWAVMVAIAQGIAHHHRTEALLRVIGTDGRSFLVQVAGTVVGGLILYWILPH
jgi:hypothetical protein